MYVCRDASENAYLCCGISDIKVTDCDIPRARACVEMPGVLTAKLVSRASRLSSKATGEAAASSRLQGALAGEDDNPLFLGGIRVPPAETITDAMGAAIATGVDTHPINGFVSD